MCVTSWALRCFLLKTTEESPDKSFQTDGLNWFNKNFAARRVQVFDQKSLFEKAFRPKTGWSVYGTDLLVWKFTKGAACNRWDGWLKLESSQRDSWIPEWLQCSSRVFFHQPVDRLYFWVWPMTVRMLVNLDRISRLLNQGHAPALWKQARLLTKLEQRLPNVTTTFCGLKLAYFIDFFELSFFSELTVFLAKRSYNLNYLFSLVTGTTSEGGFLTRPYQHFTAAAAVLKIEVGEEFNYAKQKDRQPLLTLLTKAYRLPLSIFLLAKANARLSLTRLFFSVRGERQSRPQLES